MANKGGRAKPSGHLGSGMSIFAGGRTEKNGFHGVQAAVGAELVPLRALKMLVALTRDHLEMQALSKSQERHVPSTTTIAVARPPHLAGGGNLVAPPPC